MFLMSLPTLNWLHFLQFISMGTTALAVMTRFNINNLLKSSLFPKYLNFFKTSPSWLKRIIQFLEKITSSLLGKWYIKSSCCGLTDTSLMGACDVRLQLRHSVLFPFYLPHQPHLKANLALIQRSIVQSESENNFKLQTTLGALKLPPHPLQERFLLTGEGIQSISNLNVDGRFGSFARLSQVFDLLQSLEMFSRSGLLVLRCIPPPKHHISSCRLITPIPQRSDFYFCDCICEIVPQWLHWC